MDYNKIILAFRDDEEITSFSKYLTAAGYKITAVKDGARAIELAIREVPSLIIVDLALGVVSGDRVFQILRNNPHTSRITFLFIADEMTEVRGFRPDTDIFLIRPLNLEEVHGRIRQSLMLKRLTASSHGGMAGKDIEGKLSQMSIPDILQFLEMNKKDGELRITSQEGIGSVLLKDGQIYNATFNSVSREKALYRLLLLDDGKFEFAPGECASAQKMRSSTSNLLMEGMRQIDEMKKKEAEFPQPGSCLKCKVDANTAPKGIQPIILDILKLARTYPRTSDIVEHSRYTDYEVYQGLTAMIARGLLEVTDTSAESKVTELLTQTQSVALREKVHARFSDMISSNYGKVFIISTGGPLVRNFTAQCMRIPGFTTASKSPLAQITQDTPLGEVATLRLVGALDLVLFSIPTVKYMNAIWRSFAANLIGVILIWNEQGLSSLNELSGAKRDILSIRRVPVAHVFSGGKELSEQSKAALNVGPADYAVAAENMDPELAHDIFSFLLNSLLKDDYVA